MATLYTTEITDNLLSWLADDYNSETVLRLISVPSQASIRRISDHTIRAMRLMSRLFNLYAVAQSQGITHQWWQQVTIHHDSLGKPHAVVDNRTIYFNNLSSNRHLAVVVSSTQQVGVDLSHAQQNIDPEQALDQFAPIFSDSERATIARLPDVYLAFNHFWTLKEAYTKYAGTGLHATNLAELAFVVAEPLNVQTHAIDTKNWLAATGPEPAISLVIAPPLENKLAVIVLVVGVTSVKWCPVEFTAVITEVSP